VKYFVGYDEGERLKMSRKVLKNWGRPLLIKNGVGHIFFSLRPPPIQAKIVEAAPFSHPPPHVKFDRSIATCRIFYVHLCKNTNVK
jgi:hypothetical protein